MHASKAPAFRPVLGKPCLVGIRVELSRSYLTPPLGTVELCMELLAIPGGTADSRMPNLVELILALNLDCRGWRDGASCGPEAQCIYPSTNTDPQCALARLHVGRCTFEALMALCRTWAQDDP